MSNFIQRAQNAAEEENKRRALSPPPVGAGVKRTSGDHVMNYQSYNSAVSQYESALRKANVQSAGAGEKQKRESSLRTADKKKSESRLGQKYSSMGNELKRKERDVSAGGGEYQLQDLIRRSKSSISFHQEPPGGGVAA